MPDSPNVVLAATEAVPLVKAGGLADVTSALAAALSVTGCNVTIILPAYSSIDRRAHGLRPVEGFMATVRMGDREEPVRLLQGALANSAVRLLLIEHDGFFARDDIYADSARGEEFPDAVERWVYLSRAVLASLPALGRAPDILHLNDYHVALSAAYRSLDLKMGNGFLRRTGIILGLHNLGYQGSFDAGRFGVTGLPAETMTSMGALEFWGRMNFLKAGLVYADLLTTVSPRYAQEIQDSDEYGCGLQDVLRQRRGDLVGILNGIDTNVWDPSTDSVLPARYDAASFVGKAACKVALQERSGFLREPATPVFGIISRLVSQKGIDLLLEVLPEMLRMPVQIVVLGRGRSDYEQALLRIARRHPRQLAVQFAFDDVMSHWIEAGSDFFLMPSLYEPCGLNQMYSMRYGTIPVVRRTGGLADTVEDWKPGTRRGTGIVFDDYNAKAFLAAIRRACDLYSHPEVVAAVRRSGMKQDFSWGRSAQSYLSLYEKARARRAPLVAVRAPGRAVPGLGPDGGIDTRPRIGNIRTDFGRE